ncbi:hypothetical protein [Chryseobacterium sp. SORGH_AS_1175]|uniref:hypothetical protein n=1 Tax=Chryseobacterium sp. SORGH_AS_1175 TaxID=3041760 RepID=UPI00285C5768|nr:hypothetical protein [Chryseobacterium sp. SORGH_AS_1175]MDR6130590.1 uncharacterized protein (DUF342 family) [Chryseobacterium sp. SORGH_AS_1175]
MNILHKAKDYVETLFKNRLSSIYFYHNFVHTTYTVNKAEEIMKHTPVSGGRPGKSIAGPLVS